MGNSAVDIAQGCWENGAEVTMIQRGPSYIFRRDSLVKYMYEPNFYKMTPKTEYETDLAMISSPMAVRLSRSIALTQMMKMEDAELLSALEAIGFQISYGPEGTGLIGIVTERKHPYVNDTGCLQLLAEKKIGLQTGGISHITENTVVMENGTTLEADHLVVATGYQGISASIKEILGDKVFSKLKKPLVMDEEGEIQCNWRPTGHERFWLGAHPVLFARSSSKLLALQILGIELGLNK
ncbi:hypothetical protein NQ176_g7177 [Zarea fungicola]|uniref:Uncharacterized protein n=1 Tax=Zarea fungicola TaxID=93591 RepID=A0ACC1N067_9HYPO|nr:hypothetical protein NQ176_g7177 [Lecanicillium fungicola]